MPVIQLEYLITYLIVGLFGSAFLSQNPDYVTKAINAAFALFVVLVLLGLFATVLALFGIRL